MTKEYYFKNKRKLYEKQLKRLRDNPWHVVWLSARKRCNNPAVYGYMYYGGRGIECRITSDQIKELWFRDGADKMKKPSIDRINPNGHYELSNCRFIEQAENTRRAIKGSKWISKFCRNETKRKQESFFNNLSKLYGYVKFYERIGLYNDFVSDNKIAVE